MKLDYIDNVECLEGLKKLPDNSVHCCVTSPPYYALRDYGTDGQIGLEATPEEYIASLVSVFSEVRRVLRPDGTLWVNIGDSYAGSGKGRMGNGTHHKGRSKSGDYEGTTCGRLSKTSAWGCKAKDLIGIPWMLAFALRADGWYLRQDIIWQKPNCMPESVKDRCTKSHEYIFLLSKSPKYYFDAESIREPAVGFANAAVAGSVAAFGLMQTRRRKGNAKTFRGGGVYTGGRAFNNSESVERNSHGNQKNESGLRNKRDVWSVSTAGYKGAHFAVFPEKLIEPCILAGAPIGGIVLDPFMGSGTTAVTCLKNDRHYIGIEINAQYCDIAERRIKEMIE